MSTDKPQTSQSDLKKRMEYLPNPLDPIRTLLDFATGTFVKGVWNGIWSFVTNPHVDYGTSGGGGTSIPDAIKAREGVQEILRDNQERRRNRTTQ